MFAHLVEPIASDLDLDVYDIERRGGTRSDHARHATRAPTVASRSTQLSLATRLDLSRDRPRGPDRRHVHARGHQSRSRTPAAHRSALPARGRQDRCRSALRRSAGRPSADRGRARGRRRHDAPRCCSTTAPNAPFDRSTSVDKDRATVFEWGPSRSPAARRRQDRTPRPRSRGKQVQKKSAKAATNPSSALEQGEATS